MNPDLYNKEKKIYIGSTSVNAKKILYFFLQHRLRIFGFISNNQSEIKYLYGIPVYTLNSLFLDESIIIVDENEKDLFNDEKIYLIDSETFCKEEFFFENSMIKKCNAPLMLTMILSRSMGKNSFFLVKSSEYGFWENVIKTLGLNMDKTRILSVDIENEKIYELAYYNPDDIIIFITYFNAVEIEKILDDIGLIKTLHYVHIYNSFSGHVTDRYSGFDWFLGNTYSETKDLPGFFINGCKGECTQQIVILGNSTTDPLFYPQKAWPEFLYERYNRQKKNVIIYNGAITDYSSSNELMKLLRDVILLSPDIVVSYSGFIDFRQYVERYPHINLNLMRTGEAWKKEECKEVIYGLPDDRTAYTRWLENEKIMHKICEMYNIKFYGILQPWIGSENEDAVSKLKIWNENYWSVVFPQFDKLLENASDFKKGIQSSVEKYNWLYDCTSIFAEINDESIYFDSIHTNEKGNRIIADVVWNILN